MYMNLLRVSSCRLQRKMATFNNLNFDNQALKKLPIEESGDYLIQRPIRNACFSRVKPTPIENPGHGY